MSRRAIPLAVFTLSSVIGAIAQSCTSSITPTNSIQPSIASGYAWAVIATGLTKPRSLEFDSSGNLLVLEQNKGLSSHALKDDGGVCISVASSQNIVENNGLTHGLALSADGTTVYVSTVDELYSFDYDAGNRSVGKSNTTLVTGMSGSDHTTRTILIPRLVHNQIVVSRGSIANIDPDAASEASGHSSVKSFDLASVPSNGYDYSSSGTVLGWGLRNDVGVAEHPDTGGIWSVENSVDELTRDGQDVHNDNPGEELNYLGFLNGTSTENEGSNFGYPFCFAAWSPQSLPDNKNLVVGSQFSNTSSNDTDCSTKTTSPRLTFQAHMAPIDIKFNSSATEGWITFHGSWDRTDPVGYEVALIAFAAGEPVAAPTSTSAASTIFANTNNSRCPDNCFRPAGMVFDSQGRLFVASDASGEIYVIVKDESANSSSPTSGSSSASPTTSPSPSASSSGSGGKAAVLNSVNGLLLGLVGSICVLIVMQ